MFTLALLNFVKLVFKTAIKTSYETLLNYELYLLNLQQPRIIEVRSSPALSSTGHLKVVVYFGENRFESFSHYKFFDFQACC